MSEADRSPDIPPDDHLPVEDADESDSEDVAELPEPAEPEPEDLDV
jgi:hypothetical protein